MRAYTYIVVLLVLSCLGRIGLTMRYMDLLPDKVRHIIAAKNINEGNGYAVSFQSADDITQTVYTPVKGWPPGYSILIGKMQKITGSYFTAAVAWDILSVIMLYLGLFLLVYWYKDYLNKGVTALMLLFLGVSLAPFGQLSSTDLVSISFFVLAAVLFLRWLETGRNNMILFACFVLSAVVGPFVRYGYYPVVFIFPVFLMLLALLQKDKKYALQSVLLFGIFGGFIALYTYYQYSLTGITPATTLPDRHKVEGPARLYFENLQHFNEFMYNGLLSDFFIQNRLSGTIATLYRIVKLLITFSFFFVILSVCIRQIREKKIDKVNLFILVTFIINVTFLMLLSVKNKLDESITGGVRWIWTYVIELRYYAPSYFLGFVFIMYNYGKLSRLNSLFMKVVVLPLVIVSGVYSLYTVVSGNKTGTFKHTHSNYFARYEELKKHTPDNKLLIVNGWSRSLDNNAYSSLLQLDDYKVYSVKDYELIDTTASWYWNNTERLKGYDTVYYIGDGEKLMSVLADSNLQLKPTGVEELYYLNMLN